MKLFQHSNGMVIAFGFDMLKREPDSARISWSDFNGKDWEITATNQAGSFLRERFKIAPEFVFEVNGGAVLAYQPGLCIEMTYIGMPLVWSVNFLRSDSSGTIRMAA